MFEWLKAAVPAMGGVAAAAVSALCCAGPILAVSLGVSGAGFASTFEPLRPYFLAATGLFLAVGFYGVYATPAEACVGKGSCTTVDEALRKRKREKVVLWTAVILAGVFATFPTWSVWLT
ncbi:MAG: mercuric transporter MerT family protein [Gemmatimonadota bacterium]